MIASNKEFRLSDTVDRLNYSCQHGSGTTTFLTSQQQELRKKKKIEYGSMPAFVLTAFTTVVTLPSDTSLLSWPDFGCKRIL